MSTKTSDGRRTVKRSKRQDRAAKSSQAEAIYDWPNSALRTTIKLKYQQINN
jgi:hypothetical protein